MTREHLVAAKDKLNLETNAVVETIVLHLDFEKLSCNYILIQQQQFPLP
jgi:hypothetical protein